MFDFPFATRARRLRLRSGRFAIASLVMLVAACSGVNPIHSEPTALPGDPEIALDHFLCYAVFPYRPTAFDGPQVILKDQFPIAPKPIQVGNSILLCNPARKEREDHTADIKHTKTHLVCYSIPTDTFRKKSDQPPTNCRKTHLSRSNIPRCCACHRARLATGAKASRRFRPTLITTNAISLQKTGPSSTRRSNSKISSSKATSSSTICACCAIRHRRQ